MNERKPFEPGEVLLEAGRYGGGLLRLALHYFTPADEPGKRVPWLGLEAKKDSVAPFKAVTLKPRELRALAGALLAAADRLEAEGYDLEGARTGRAPRAPDQHRTEGARTFLDRGQKPGVRRG
jgi:hypothetical protein